MNEHTRTLIRIALEEDLADRGDLTSLNFVDAEHRSIGKIVSREEAVISGSEVAAEVCRAVDPDLRFRSITHDGGSASVGDVVAEIVGPTRAVLTAERTVLNFMQRLSGIATITRSYVDLIGHTEASLLDTRKTTPGWRALEKQAVMDGGGTNHRFGLYDAIMVKDNHLVANPSPLNIAERVDEVKAREPELKIELEVDRLDQLKDYLRVDGIDVILLDNMNNNQLREAVSMRDQSGSDIRLEASGGVNLSTVKGIAETGVDFISVGALTHSVRSIDLGLDLSSLDE